MKKYLILWIIFVSCFQAFSQSDSIDFSPKSSLFLELGGPAMIYSFNYEYSLLRKHRSLVPHFRVGISYLRVRYLEENNFEYLIVPVEVGLHTARKHAFESGIGASFLNMGYLLFFKVGYRFTSSRGFLLKISPMMVYNGERALPWIGIGIGKSF